MVEIIAKFVHSIREAMGRKVANGPRGRRTRVPKLFVNQKPSSAPGLPKFPPGFYYGL
jgi:hypothetical protein